LVFHFSSPEIRLGPPPLAYTKKVPIFFPLFGRVYFLLLNVTLSCPVSFRFPEFIFFAFDTPFLWTAGPSLRTPSNFAFPPFSVGQRRLDLRSLAVSSPAFFPGTSEAFFCAWRLFLLPPPSFPPAPISPLLPTFSAIYPEKTSSLLSPCRGLSASCAFRTISFCPSHLLQTTPSRLIKHSPFRVLSLYLSSSWVLPEVLPNLFPL